MRATHVKLNDPALGLDRLRVIPVDETGECFTLHTSGETQRGTLERCNADAWTLAHEHAAEVDIAVEDAWEITIADEAEPRECADYRILIRADAAGDESTAPDAGVLAWAALVVIWRDSTRAPGRG